MLADVGQRLIFPPEVATTNLQPDIVLLSGSERLVHLVELTVPWEDAVDEAYERKKLRYAQLATEAEQRGWRVRVYPVEDKNVRFSKGLLYDYEKLFGGEGGGPSIESDDSIKIVFFCKICN
ncbi:UNVERIFIED_CONTAM: hypothetical protein FKN15_040099 [Acipenser sinensis]